MKSHRLIARLVFVAVSLMALLPGASAQDTAKVLLIAGQNNHNWRKSNPFLDHILGSHEQIDCAIDNAPSKKADDDAWQLWNPRFADYDVVVLNYNGQHWPEPIKQRFVHYIRGGGNAIVLHAANNAFTGWDEYEEMVGLLWRSPDYGNAIYLRDDGKEIRLPPGQGGSMGHGRIFDWVMTTRDHANPVTKGLPRHWKHAHDELYHGQRGPAKNVHVLLTAYSDPKHGGTGRHEPIVWWVPFGRGKVITNVMGHVGDIDCLRCVGFQTVLHRSVLWLAGITIDTRLPDDFPIADQTSMVPMSSEALGAIENANIDQVTEVINARQAGTQGLEAGLQFAVFEGDWTSLPDFGSLTPSSSGITEDVTISVSNKADEFAIKFDGFIFIEEPGDYSFFTTSDDGSRLLLDGVTIVDNDGIHGETQEAARVTLDRGVYPFEVQFFEAAGGEALSVTYSGPGIAKQPIPSDVLFHFDTE